jgi:hypothetical protein
MSEYDFFVSHLRFIASRTDRDNPDVTVMIDQLERIADAVENTGGFAVPPEKLRVAGRGLAGLAGFLQQQILPEVIAAGNTRGEIQVRWVIDTSMNLMSTLMARADSDNSNESAVFKLPPPPEI